MILINRAANAKTLDDAIIHLQNALKGYQPQDQMMIAAYPNPDSTDPFPGTQRMTPTDSSHLDQLRRALDVPKLGVKSNVPSPLDVPLEGALTWMGSSFVPTAINAILLIEMSPGSAQPDDAKLRDRCSRQPPSGFVRVFSVGPGNNRRLIDLTRACKGAHYRPGEVNKFLIDVIPDF